MRASLLARLLSGLQPDRRSVQQDQGYGAPSRSAHEGGFGGGVGRSAFGAQRPGRSRVFRACWLLSTSPITVKRAVGLFAINALTAFGSWWFLFPLIGWGIALTIHGVVLFFFEGRGP